MTEHPISGDFEAKKKFLSVLNEILDLSKDVPFKDIQGKTNIQLAEALRDKIKIDRDYRLTKREA